MDNTQLLKELNSCFAACNACYSGCLNEKDVTMMVRCIELNRDCADICQFTASLLTRDSENLDKILTLCGEICRDCAEECEKHEYEHCKKCAEACRKCSEMCLSQEPAAKQ